MYTLVFMLSTIGGNHDQQDWVAQAVHRGSDMAPSREVTCQWLCDVLRELPDSVANPRTESDLFAVECDEAIQEGTTLSLPTFNFTTVTTTVSVPDGGTVLLGGVKRLREGWGNFAVPILSNISDYNRHCKNVDIGREAQSLMPMVTPRIIITGGEEEKLGLTIPEDDAGR